MARSTLLERRHLVQAYTWHGVPLTTALTRLTLGFQVLLERLCGEFDFDNYEMREGDYGCVFSFCLKDGRIYEYTAIPKPGLTTIFCDGDGTYYKAKNVPMKKLYNDLQQERQPGNPFQTK